MNSQELQKMQEYFLQEQSKIKEYSSSVNKEITVELDGNVQIKSISFHSSKNIDDLNLILIDTINVGIRNVTEKVRNLMLRVEQEMKVSPPPIPYCKVG